MALHLPAHIPNREKDLTVDFEKSLPHDFGGPPQLRMTARSSNAQPVGLLKALYHSWENRLDARCHATKKLNELHRSGSFSAVPVSSIDRKTKPAASSLTETPESSELADIQNHILNCRHLIANVSKPLASLKPGLAGRSNKTSTHGGNPQARPTTGVGAGAVMHNVRSMMTYPILATKECTHTAADSLDQASELIEADPLDCIEKTGVSKEVFSQNSTFGADGTLIELAILEIKSGIQEIKHAARHHKKLKRAITQLEHDIASLDALRVPQTSSSQRTPMSQTDHDNLSAQVNSMVTCLRSIKQLNKQVYSFLHKQNRLDSAIGACSVTSGSAVLAKASASIISKAAASAADGNTVAAAASHITEFITTGLEPTIGIGAVATGAYKVHQSRQKLKSFRAAREATVKRIKNEHVDKLIAQLREQGHDIDEDKVGQLHHYLKFQDLKLNQRDQFFTSYARWNNSFLAGGSIYAASMLAKAGVAGAVAAGTAGAAAAHPGVAGGILAGTLVGLAMMSASSQRSFIDYHKHRRYQSYYTDDDPELNRTFLESMDVLNWNSSDSSPLDGLLLQSAFYEQIYQREDQRQTFLSEVAEQLGKRYDEKYVYTADLPDRGAKPTTQQFIARTARRAAEDSAGRLKAASSFLLETVKLQPLKTGTQAAKRAWNDSRDYLTRTSLKKWLAEPSQQTQTRQIELLEHMLDTQIHYLHEKLDAKTRTYRNVARKLTGVSRPISNAERIEDARISTTGQFADASVESAFKKIFNGLDAQVQHIEDVSIENHPADVPRGLALKEMLVGLDKDLERDQRLYRDAVAVLAQFKELKQRRLPLTKEDSRLLAHAIDQFISVQQGELVDPHARRPDLTASHDRLATYLMKGAPRRYRDLRGKLTETLMQATRQIDSHTATLNTPQDAGSKAPSQRSAAVNQVPPAGTAAFGHA